MNGWSAANAEHKITPYCTSIKHLKDIWEIYLSVEKFCYNDNTKNHNLIQTKIISYINFIVKRIN